MGLDGTEGDVTTGVVVDFDDHVGLGRVRTDSGDEILFHCAEISDGSRTIPVGRRVRFSVRHKFSRPEAFSIAPE